MGFVCACGSDAFESEMIPGMGVVRSCLGCGTKSVDGNVQAQPVGTLEEKSQTPQVPQATQPQQSFRLEPPQPKQPKRAVGPQPAEAPLDVIKLAKRRLRFVKAEIKRLRKLEKEQAQLERILSAADGKPVAVVRELRRSS